MLVRLMPFTALLTHNPADDSRILPGGYALPSFQMGIATCSQNGGWLVRVAGVEQDRSGQSYEGGTSP
jgi:hypothetical protein